jgi:hypothetical protein
MRLLCFIGLIGLISLTTACVDEDEYADTPQGNLEALWRIIDEHYCFLDYKQHEYGLNWQQTYDKYKVRVNNNSPTNNSLRCWPPCSASYATDMST